MGPVGVVKSVTGVRGGIRVGAPGMRVSALPMGVASRLTKGVTFKLINVAVGSAVGNSVAGSGVGEKEIAVSVSWAATVAAAEVKMATGSISVGGGSAAPPQAVKVRISVISWTIRHFVCVCFILVLRERCKIIRSYLIFI